MVMNQEILKEEIKDPKDPKNITDYIKKRFSSQIGGENTSFNINFKIYKSNEELETEERNSLSKKDISEGQIKYLKYLAYKKNEFNKINWRRVENINMWEAKQLIEEWK